MPVTATPLCRCRVLYIGSAVPLKSKDGLQGIQDPLKQLYPVDSAPDTKGVDAWLSVWINGLVLEYVENPKELFFPIQTLHYCAAVRYVNVGGYALEGGGEKFLPLDSPFANLPQTQHPPIFAAILRRTQGVKVLECHAFICTNEKAANALVRCCFNAYADSSYLDMTSEALGVEPPFAAVNGTVDVTDNAAGASKTVSPRALHDNRSASPKSDQMVGGKNGYREEDDDERQDMEHRMNLAKAKHNWQNRQQSGDYETASISSSLAGKYKKKDDKQATNPAQIGKKEATTLQHKRPPSATANYSNAVVPFIMPYQEAGTMTGRRARSETDLKLPKRDTMMPLSIVPYAPPYLRPPFSPMLMPPGPPFSYPARFPGPHPPVPPPLRPSYFSMPPNAMAEFPIDARGWGPPPPPPQSFIARPGMLPSPGQSVLTAPSKKKKKYKKQNVNTLFMHHPPFATMPPYGMVPPRPPFSSFEEPPYSPGQFPMPMMCPGGTVPFASHPFQPGGLQGAHGMAPYYAGPPGSDDVLPFDDYQDSFRPKSKSQSNRPQKQRDVDQGSIDDSPVNSRRSAALDERSPIMHDYWENRNVYDGSSLFRRQNLNEKAFGTSIKQESTQIKSSRYADSQNRPAEPAPDYGKINGNSTGIERENLEYQFRDMNVNGRHHF